VALEFVSTSKGLGFGEDVGPEGSVCGRKGGGSMMDWTAGSGRADIVSSEEVSIVICLVGGEALRLV